MLAGDGILPLRRLFEYERDGGEKVKIYIVGIGFVPLFFARVRLCLQQYFVGIFELHCLGNGIVFCNLSHILFNEHRKNPFVEISAVGNLCAYSLCRDFYIILAHMV